MADQGFRYQEKVLPDGSAVILNENGVIEVYDASGNLVATYPPSDPAWKTQAAVFDIAA
jgi:hypothetical protein